MKDIPNTAIETKAERNASVGARSKKNKNLVIVMLGMFAAGILTMAVSAYEIMGSLGTNNWPGTDGTITSSSVRKEVRRDSGKTVTTYYPSVQYRYRIDGRQHTSYRIAFGKKVGSVKAIAQKVVDRYPSGKTVTVYYDPDDPQYAILEKGFKWSSLIVFMVGLVFFAAGVLCLRSYLKDKQKVPTP